jgi:hypothetical protein
LTNGDWRCGACGRVDALVEQLQFVDAVGRQKIPVRLIAGYLKLSADSASVTV